ncbi:MAG: glycosyltransferase [Pseudomonadota bacterium]
MSMTATSIGGEMVVDAPRVQPESILAVIPTLNEAVHIESCIRSLMTGNPSLKSVPLVIVDGGSTDATVAIVEDLKSEFENLSVLENPKRLQSAALNLAVTEAATEKTHWLVRCDAHSLYPENFILDIAESLVETRAESVVIAMDAVGTSCFEKANAWVVDTPLGSGGAAHRGGKDSGYVDHGHHAGFAIEDFRRLGGYDESFSHNEDAEYDARLIAQGGRIFLDADIRIQYVPRGSISGLAKQYFNYGKGRARNAAKNKMSLKIRQMLPVFALIANLLGLAIAPVFLPALIVPLGYLSVLALMSIYVILRHFSLCGIWAGPALGTMHMSWGAGFLKQRFGGAPEAYEADTEQTEHIGSGFSATHVVSILGRNVINLFSPITGRRSTFGAPRPANENYRIHRPVTRVTKVPDGMCVYAIGDIHGRLDLLEVLIAQIEIDAADLPEDVRPTIVFLGDYIDRGLQSRQIIDLFLGDRLDKFETVYLMGNHEEALLNFIQDPNFGEKWAMYGGAETLFSYGLQPPPRGLKASNPAAAQDAWVTLWNQFRGSLPDDHLTFYQTLKLSHTIGDYVFVHAGMRPGVPLDQQRGEDMMWIREEFLAASGNFEKLVVHGHTPTDSVHRDNRRIGLDTGAYMTGRLSAARFLDKDIQYLST